MDGCGRCNRSRGTSYRRNNAQAHSCARPDGCRMLHRGRDRRGRHRTNPGVRPVGGNVTGSRWQRQARRSRIRANTNISIRVLSPGNDGNVTQSNTAASTANAGNTATTSQSSNQNAGGAGAIQTSQQGAWTDQLAIALSAANAVEPEQRQRADPRAQPGQRRQRDAVQHRGVHGHREQRGWDHPVEHAERLRIAVWVRRPGARDDDAGTGVDAVRV